MQQEPDEEFFNRADAHINLSNEQTADCTPGKVSASMMYATARFNAWLTAIGFESAEDMVEQKEEVIKYFVEQYQSMLSDNFDDYVSKFETYMERL